jgi:hypothetical protein
MLQKQKPPRLLPLMDQVSFRGSAKNLQTGRLQIPGKEILRPEEREFLRSVPRGTLDISGHTNCQRRRPRLQAAPLTLQAGAIPFPGMVYLEADTLKST